jgi:hypothetical protein
MALLSKIMVPGDDKNHGYEDREEPCEMQPQTAASSENIVMNACKYTKE